MERLQKEHCTKWRNGSESQIRWYFCFFGAHPIAHILFMGEFVLCPAAGIHSIDCWHWSHCVQHLYLYLCICICVFVFVCAYLYLYVCICICNVHICIVSSWLAHILVGDTGPTWSKSVTNFHHLSLSIIVEISVKVLLAQKKSSIKSTQRVNPQKKVNLCFRVFRVLTGDTGECHQWWHWPHSVKIGDKLPSIYLSSSYSVEIYLEYHSKSWKTFQVWDFRFLTFQVCSGHIRCEFPRGDCCLCFRKVEDTGLLKRNIFDNNWEIYLTISEKYDILQELDFQNLRNTLPPVFR